eukprot:scaffold35222_cov72-Phaeocystis_antarctica.AAC.1
MCGKLVELDANPLTAILYSVAASRAPRQTISKFYKHGKKYALTSGKKPVVLVAVSPPLFLSTLPFAHKIPSGTMRHSLHPQCCGSRSSEGAADVVSALNARFRAGRPSDDPASAGVVVHAIDNPVIRPGAWP